MFADVAEVTIAKNGQEVLDFLALDSSYVMILMDLQMPVLDGIAATKAIRANPAWDHIFIVGFTASTFSDELQAGISAGMFELLSKQTPRARLLKVLDDCIARSEHP